MITSMKAQCNPKLKEILGSRLCQKAPLHNEFDFIKAKCNEISQHWDLY